MERSAETTRDDPDGEYIKRNRWFESGSLQRRVIQTCWSQQMSDYGQLLTRNEVWRAAGAGARGDRRPDGGPASRRRRNRR